MASSSVHGARDDAEYSANTTRSSPSRRVPPMESAGARVGSSAQVLPLDAPSSLLRLLLGLYMVGRRSFAANDIRTGATACCPTAPFVENDLLICAANACCSTTPSVTNDNQKADADLCPPKAGVLPLNTPSSLLCLLLGLYIVRRQSFEANDIRTSVGNACCPTAPFAANELQICAANACHSTAPPAANDKQQGDADPSPPRAGVLPLNTPSSLLCLLLGLYIVQSRSFEANDIRTTATKACCPTAPFAANDIRTGATACCACPTAPFVANDLLICAANACCSIAPSVTNDNQKADADLRPPKAGVLPLYTPSSLLCLLLGLYIVRRQSFEANDIRTSVGNAYCPTAPFAANELQICAANACHSTAPPTANDKQQVDADPSPPRSGVLPLNTPSSLLCLLLGLYIVQSWSFEANDIRTGATKACCPTAPFATNDIRTGAADACYHTAPSAENDDQQALSVANDSHPGSANPSCAATIIRKIFMLLWFGRLQVSEERTLAPPSMCHQFLLPIPVIAAISKVPRFWRRLGCWAVLSSVMAITGQGAILFRGLSTILAQSGFMTRLCGYIIKWFGYEGHLFVRAAEFVDLVSTFFRHASSSLRSASDILSMINAFHSSNGSSSESVPLDNESNVPSSQEIINTDHTSVQCIIVSSISEGRMAISQWKTENAQIYVDVPPTMSPETAKVLKLYFEEEGANHLLNGPTFNAILEKALLQGSSLPSPSPSTDTCHD